jgi:hypothetical protein
MLRSLWLRLTSSGPSPAEGRALARYYQDEGLHAELASQLGSLNDTRAGTPLGFERNLYAAHSYLAA